MSTRYTKKGIPLAESQTLQLTQNASLLSNAVTKYLSLRLINMGHESITPSLLSFLSILECGVNYGSEIARSLGVTRQMVAKTVKELCRLGYLEQLNGEGKQKEILFTDDGEQLMSDSRRLLSEVDEVLLKHFDNKRISRIAEELNRLAGALDSEF